MDGVLDNEKVNDSGTMIANHEDQFDDGHEVAVASDASERDVTGGLFGSESEADDDGSVVNLLYIAFSNTNLSHSSQKGSKKRRKLNDEELDSGDDQDRSDRVDGDDGDNGMEERAETVLDVKLGRHAVPHPSDGQVCRLTW